MPVLGNADGHASHRNEVSFRKRAAGIKDGELVAAGQVVAQDALELTRLPIDARVRVVLGSGYSNDF
jgi:hypothetical protein